MIRYYKELQNNLANNLAQGEGWTPPNKTDTSTIIKHTESFKPAKSHYRRKHAPNRRYLSSDLSKLQMYEDFKKKHPDIACSYDV